MEEEKVWLTSRNLADDAQLWFLQVQRDEGTPAWHHFTKLLHLRFGSLPAVTSVLADGMHRLQEGMDHVAMMINRVCAHLEKSGRERLAAVWLQAAARGALLDLKPDYPPSPSAKAKPSD